MNDQDSKFILTFERHSLRRDLLRNAWIILLAGVIAFMALYIAGRSAYSPKYTSRATLAVRVKNGNGSMLDNLAYSAETAGIYAAVFQSPSMKALAAQNLGLDAFSGTISASVVEDINLMTVSVTADDPELAYHLLSSVLAVYPQISDAIFSNAVIDVMEAPQMPDEATGALSLRTQLIVIALVMAAQTALVVLLSLLRETVKHEAAFERMIDGRLLGTVAHERPHIPVSKRLFRRRPSLLIDSAYASLRFSEDHQNLATRLEYLKSHRGASVFAITSVAENEGKSTITANLALALADRGRRVVVLDLDLRRPSLYRVIGCHDELAQDLGDVLSGRVNVRDYALFQYRPGLFFALSRRGRRDTADWLGSDRTQRILSYIRGKADFVLIDTPPMAASADAAALARLADRVILTIRTDRSAAADINDAIATLSATGSELAGCILNDVYRPFTFWGQMGADEGGAYYTAGKQTGRYTAAAAGTRGSAAWQTMDGLDA